MRSDFPALPDGGASLPSPAGDLKEALLAVDPVRAGRILGDACAASSPVSCIEALVVPVLEEIGRGWEEGQVALSQVYMSGRICEEIVNTMLPPGSPGRISQPKMAIAVLEDHHTLGKRILLAVLRSGGYEVTDYGSGVTVDGLVERVIRDGIEILLISTLMLPAALRAKEAIARIKEALPETRVIVGGAPFRFDPHLWREAGADAVGHSASDTLATVRAMAGGLMTGGMTPAERAAVTMGFEEPDRVPLFLLFTIYGAKELGLSIREYFSKPEYVAAGQMRLYRKFGGDCLNPFCYAASEVEAWGGEVIFSDNSPPNAGRPPIREPGEIESIEVPLVEESPSLLFGLRTIELLKREVGDDVPIMGSVISPFSLPILQMGFAAYIELLYSEPDLFRTLMKKNEEFCVRWANAQLEAGATAIGYADPLASPDMTPRDLYRRTGFVVAKRTISRIGGAVATSLASARALPVIDDVAATGSVGIGVSTFDDLAAVKRQCAGRLTILGNLNAIEMCRWTPAQAEAEVKKAIAAAGPGGGFVLSDNHGEIPWQVPESVLLAISAAVRKWGRYPLDRVSV